MKINRLFMPIIICVLIILFFPSIFLEAQERVKSLSIRQFEIEESIRNGLKYYLEPKDYVLRVKLFGEERAINVANETLPGFGQLNEPSKTSGAKYWEIKSMRVDLVMHKEVSPSVNTYIGEIVPILSGIDYERGDELVFVPILPSEPFPQPSNVTSSADLPDSMIKASTEEGTSNDDASKSIDKILSLITDAVKEGLSERKKEKEGTSNSDVKEMEEAAQQEQTEIKDPEKIAEAETEEETPEIKEEESKE